MRGRRGGRSAIALARKATGHAVALTGEPGGDAVTLAREAAVDARDSGADAVAIAIPVAITIPAGIAIPVTTGIAVTLAPAVVRKTVGNCRDIDIGHAKRPIDDALVACVAIRV